MVDWNGLFKWSMSFNDGTRQSNFKEMAKEDRKWLEEFLTQYTLNDADELKRICIELKDHVNIEHDRLVSLLQDLEELVELHERNSLNLCICKGIETILDIILTSKHDQARIEACQIFSFAVQNSPQVQEIAYKVGTMQIMLKYVDETNAKNKEALMGTISAFLRGHNFEMKRIFFEKFEGLVFLRETVMDSGNTTERLLRKILFFIHELFLNDNQVYPEKPTFARSHFAQDLQFVEKLQSFVSTEDNSTNARQIRDYSLFLMRFLVNINPELLATISESLNSFKAKVQARLAVEESDSMKEQLESDLELVEKVFSAVGANIEGNFEGDTGVEVISFKVGEAKNKEEQKVLSLGM